MEAKVVTQAQFGYSGTRTTTTLETPMINLRLWGALLVALLAIGCSQAPDPPSLRLPTAAPTRAATPTRQPLPTATVPPPPTQTPPPPTAPPPTAPPPTARPTIRPTTEPTASAGTAADPDLAADEPPNGDFSLIWLPFGFGSYGEPLLAVQDGRLLDLPEPAERPIEAYFDFHPEGYILYGSQFWQAAANEIDSVTDLWLATYDAQTAAFRSRPIFDGQIGRAAFNPEPGQMGFPIAVAIHNGQGFDLLFKFGIGTEEVIATDIEPFFSWSPDGQQIAFVQAGRLALFDVAEWAVQPLNVDLRDAGFGWVGDAPVWDIERQVIFYPADPFLIVPLPGSTLPQGEPYVPLLLDDEPLFDPRPSTMLWAPELRHLVVQHEDLEIAVQIYLLSSDLTYVTDTYFLEGATLAGWFESGRSIVILDEFGVPAVWDLESFAYILFER